LTGFTWRAVSSGVRLKATQKAEATLTLTFPNNLPSDTTYWKYGENHIPQWYTIPAIIDGNKITITLTDGGVGDDDGLANGIIHDDGGPSIPQTPVPPTPELSTIALMGVGMLGLLFVTRRMK